MTSIKFSLSFPIAMTALMTVQPMYAQSLEGNLPTLEYCQQYREDAVANANSSSIRGSASGWGTAGAGGGNVSGQQDQSNSSAKQARIERNCNQLLQSAGEVTIEQIRAGTQQQSIQQNGTTDRYTACLQAAQYAPDSRKQDHLMGCQCISQGQTPEFYGATGIFHSCKKQD